MSKNEYFLLKNFSGKTLECGCDEAGRGCLAGPVVAAAVILPYDFECVELTDSKKLTEHQRDKLRKIIEENALAWAVSFVSETEIDKINILNASILAMHKAIEQLEIQPEFIVVDGNKFKPYRNIPHQTIVKGDSKYLSIAAASVLAKTHRDEWMKKLHEEFPQYGWDKNMAYATQQHRQALMVHGYCIYHRMSFRLDYTPEKDLFSEQTER
ncbi:Ribonuclease HII [uncultured Paludibacter sp.]|uniref:Ribonuclease HII n=1 Tax=uncultured Paludibacter sp. TaxID=497635 RepID=A0A653AK47_9BACT|nr:Ribonuclease HII [uncultured Paludibacter sp.]